MLSNQFIKRVTEKKYYSFAFWFILGSLVVIFGYEAFSQPVLMDRAYLLYMAQTIFRGDSLYESTTYGYTPLATLISGYWMKLTVPLGLSTITASKILGITIYGLNAGCFYILSKKVFIDKRSSWLSSTLFIGLSYLAVWSGAGAEPKHFVLLFTTIGLIQLIQQRWFLVGLMFGLASMCWQVSIISFFTIIPILPWKSIKELKKTIIAITAGVVVAIIPVLIYLWATNSWIQFWNQAILRKILFEGSEVGERPLKWIKEAWFPSYLGDILHFLAGALGFFLLILSVLHKTIIGKTSVINSPAVRPIISITLIWAAFNTVEFQGPPDNITLLPSIVLLAGYFFSVILIKLNNKIISYALISLLMMYNFFDLLVYKSPYSLHEQIATISGIQAKYVSQPFTINFEEFYAITEQSMPTRYVRHAKYEDVLINDIYNEKILVYDALNTSKYIISKHPVTEYSSEYDKLRNIFINDSSQKREVVSEHGVAELYLNELTLIPVDSFQIKVDVFFMAGDYYRKRKYIVFKNNSAD